MRLSLTIALVLLVFKPTFLMAVHLGSSPFDVDESPAAPETASCDLSSTLFESGFSPTSMNFGSLGVPPSEAECSLVKQRIRDSKDVGEVLSSVTDGKFTPDDSFLERSMKVYQKYDLLDPEGTTKVTEPMIKEFLTVAAKVDPTEPVVKKVEELVKEKEKRTAP
ncbi:hypothetical protein EBT16_11170, partial [bacterium]|nr:hypothetical protein [bacterium]